jgi:hypothetical protein
MYTKPGGSCPPYHPPHSGGLPPPHPPVEGLPPEHGEGLGGGIPREFM